MRVRRTDLSKKMQDSQKPRLSEFCQRPRWRATVGHSGWVGAERRSLLVVRSAEADLAVSRAGDVHPEARKPVCRRRPLESRGARLPHAPFPLRGRLTGGLFSSCVGSADEMASHGMGDSTCPDCRGPWGRMRRFGTLQSAEPVGVSGAPRASRRATPNPSLAGKQPNTGGHRAPIIASSFRNEQDAGLRLTRMTAIEVHRRAEDGTAGRSLACRITPREVRYALSSPARARSDPRPHTGL